MSDKPIIISIDEATRYTYWSDGVDRDPPVAIVLHIEIEIDGESHLFFTGLDYRHYDDPDAVISALKGKRFIAVPTDESGTA